MNEEKEKPRKIPKKIIGVILAPVLLALITLVFILIMQQYNQPDKPLEKVDESVMHSPDISYIKSSVYEWITSQKNEEGAYYQSEVCTSDEVCEKTNAEQSTYAIWGIYKYAKNADNNALFTELESKLQTYSQQTEKMSENWKCKHLSEYAKDPRVTEGARESAKTLCDNAAIQQVIGEGVPLFEVRQRMESIMSTTTQGEEEGNSNAEEEFFEATTATSGEAAKARWNETDTVNALSHFNNALTIYESAEDMVSDRTPLLVIASLDLYDLTHEQSFLQFAKFIYSKHSILKTCINLTHCTEMLMATRELRQATGEEHYKEYVNKFTSQVLNSYFDSDEYAQQLSKNAFYKNEDGEIVYPIRENALLLGILSQE